MWYQSQSHPVPEPLPMSAQSSIYSTFLKTPKERTSSFSGSRKISVQEKYMKPVGPQITSWSSTQLTDKSFQKTVLIQQTRATGFSFQELQLRFDCSFVPSHVLRNLKLNKPNCTKMAMLTKPISKRIDNVLIYITSSFKDKKSLLQKHSFNKYF